MYTIIVPLMSFLVVFSYVKKSNTVQKLKYRKSRTEIYTYVDSINVSNRLDVQVDNNYKINKYKFFS